MKSFLRLVFDSIPLMNVRNSLCRTFPLTKSIFRASKRVNRNLSFSYSPLTDHLKTANVRYSMMFEIRLDVITDLLDLEAREIQNEAHHQSVSTVKNAHGSAS